MLPSSAPSGRPEPALAALALSAVLLALALVALAQVCSTAAAAWSIPSATKRGPVFFQTEPSAFASRTASANCTP
jgi:hypothetical protein